MITWFKWRWFDIIVKLSLQRCCCSFHNDWNLAMDHFLVWTAGSIILIILNSLQSNHFCSKRIKCKLKHLPIQWEEMCGILCDSSKFHFPIHLSSIALLCFHLFCIVLFCYNTLCHHFSLKSNQIEAMFTTEPSDWHLPILQFLWRMSSASMNSRSTSLSIAVPWVDTQFHRSMADHRVLPFNASLWIHGWKEGQTLKYPALSALWLQ
jgi:hypothetical protein